MANNPWLQEIRNVAAIVRAADETLDLTDLPGGELVAIIDMRDSAYSRLVALLSEDERSAALQQLVVA